MDNYLNMIYSKENFYISKQELEDLDKIVQMALSPDPEQKQLALSLYKEIVPSCFKFLCMYGIVSNVEIPEIQKNISRKNFIIV